MIRAYLNAVASELPAATGYAVIYQRAADGTCFTPVASHGAPLTRMPRLPVDELDNPVVYSTLSKAPCLVDNVATLVDVGVGYEALRCLLPGSHAMLSSPLVACPDASATVVLLLAGDGSELKAWRDDTAWARLGTLVAALIAVSSHEQTHGSATRRPMKASVDVTTEDRSKATKRWIGKESPGTSTDTQELREEILLLADSPLSVLITGETGAGKDHAAKLIHRVSARSEKPFVAINCASIPGDLIEAELFGAVRGAYTGSVGAREGLVAAAHGGTLLLDEIGDMPLALQGSLLRLLNEKKYRPLGSTREHSSDFRLLCATHRPLQELVEHGLFREDLYFRICQHTLHISPLRDRPDDIEAIVAHAASQFNQYGRAQVRGIEPGALKLLRAYRFPGNVRELRNIVMAACERTASGSPLDAQTVAKLLTVPGTKNLSGTRATPSTPEDIRFSELLDMNSLPKACSAFEMLVIQNRLSSHGGSRTRAAQSLGITTRTLARKAAR